MDEITAKEKREEKDSLTQMDDGEVGGMMAGESERGREREGERVGEERATGGAEEEEERRAARGIDGPQRRRVEPAAVARLASGLGGVLDGDLLVSHRTTARTSIIQVTRTATTIEAASS